MTSTSTVLSCVSFGIDSFKDRGLEKIIAGKIKAHKVWLSRKKKKNRQRRSSNLAAYHISEMVIYYLVLKFVLHFL